ncbi:hypothetical protein VIGAN_09066000, partial [Vigna angularis var. angularis]
SSYYPNEKVNLKKKKIRFFFFRIQNRSSTSVPSMLSWITKPWGKPIMARRRCDDDGVMVQTRSRWLREDVGRSDSRRKFPSPPPSSVLV